MPAETPASRAGLFSGGRAGAAIGAGRVAACSCSSFFKSLKGEMKAGFAARGLGPSVPEFELRREPDFRFLAISIARRVS